MIQESIHAIVRCMHVFVNAFAKRSVCNEFLFMTVGPSLVSLLSSGFFSMFCPSLCSVTALSLILQSLLTIGKSFQMLEFCITQNPSR